MSVNQGELCYGARKSRRVEANLARVDELVAGSTILVCDAETARQYGEVKNNLRLKGRPLPEIGLKLEVASERAIQRKRNAIRPDISIWRGDTLLAAIECKTQLGWRRHDWAFHFDEREKKLKEIFPTATMFLLVMTGCNWPGFGNDPRSGKQMLCLLKDLWPTQIPKSFDPLILETPIERLLEQVKCL